ncbi:MAG: hypothetical protein JO022_18960, partial [Acidobacteriaceae bacterium]|nr:hypothetical protein [Acidobacteriaceae bacterium]
MIDAIVQNVVAYSLQTALTLSLGALALALLRLAPRWRLLCWQCLVMLCLAIPAFQTWEAAPDSGSVSITMHTLNSAAATSRAYWRPGNWSGWIAAVLLIGVIFRLVLMLLGMRRLCFYRDRAVPARAPLPRHVSALAARAYVGISRDISAPVA